MADLIDRTEFIALMERGYCEPCKEEKLDRNGVCCRVCWVNDAISEIDRIPTIDAVPVVRCKDCIWFGGKYGCPLAESGYFKSGKLLPHENDFCSYGERRKENGRTTID